MAVFFKNRLYDRGWRCSHKVSCTVVSVGNIVAGGTGKTPFVVLLARTFQQRKLAILTRGYGDIPDEALLMQRRLPNVKIYIGKNRVHFAKQAVKEGAELILLDDGFQHRALHRDVDIVLLRGDDLFGKKHFLPWGYLRDSPKRLEKTDAIFIHGSDFIYIPHRVLDTQEQPILSIQGWKLGIFCGIANPESFKKLVVNLGAEIVAEWVLADHELAHPAHLERFAIHCKSLGAQALMTTEKDFIKKPQCSLPIVFMEIEIVWLAGQNKWVNLIEKINQKIDNNLKFKVS